MSALLRDLGPLLLTAIAGTGLSFGIILALMPWLKRVALANPDHRSSHKRPTPQGGGLGLVGGTLGIAGLALTATGAFEASWLWLGGAVAGLTLLGLLDDHRPLGWRVKLAVQTGCALLAAQSLPIGPLGIIPAGIVLMAATFILVAMVNFTNFTDGIDEISVAQGMPALAIPMGLAVMGGLGLGVGHVSAAAFGALAGFWWWNRHPARLFLGDSGSLPLGLLLGWLGLFVGLSLSPALGLLIVLYPLVEGGVTVITRLIRRQRLTEPHRDHAYQRAVDHGLSPRRVAGTVGCVSTLGSMIALTAFGMDGRHNPAGMTAIFLAAASLMASPIFIWMRMTAAKRGNLPRL